jgi:acyl-lipid omega-6 desaturase (Delta-12 desaturase)
VSINLESRASVQCLHSEPSIAELKPLLVPFQKPSTPKALWQVTNSVILYIVLWVLIFWSLRISHILTGALTLAAGILVVRVFIIMHDCGHGSFTNSQNVNNLIGTISGILVFTPYYHWRWEHATHHATSGNLDHRGTGDIWTMTTDEYLQSSSWMRLAYRLARCPLILFVFAPMLLFLIWNRFASSEAKLRERLSVWLTNICFVCIMLTLGPAFGWKPFLIIQCSIAMIGGGIGIWMFYVQHQFEGAYWEQDANWTYVAAALRGSSFYNLPKILHWISGNIGFHHIHHLNPGVPNYNLPRCHEAGQLFKGVPTLTLRKSLRCCRLNLWDERLRRLVSFRDVKS